MADDIKARLRARRLCKDGVRRQPHKHEREAADHIEALEARIAELEGCLRQVKELARLPQGVTRSSKRATIPAVVYHNVCAALNQEAGREG